MRKSHSNRTGCLSRHLKTDNHMAMCGKSTLGGCKANRKVVGPIHGKPQSV